CVADRGRAGADRTGGMHGVSAARIWLRAAATAGLRVSAEHVRATGVWAAAGLRRRALRANRAADLRAGTGLRAAADDVRATPRLRRRTLRANRAADLRTADGCATAGAARLWRRALRRRQLSLPAAR